MAAFSCSKIIVNTLWPFRFDGDKSEWLQCIYDKGCNYVYFVRAMIVQNSEVFVCNMENLTNSPLFLCECKYWGKSVDFNAMSTIVGELEETVWKEMEAVALLFCVTYQPYKKVRP